MSNRTSLSSTDMLSVMRHLADVVALKGDPPAQRQLLIDGLSRIVGTNQAFLFVGDQWRRDKRPHFVHQTLSQDRDPVFLKYMAEFGVRYPLTADPFCARSIGDARPVQLWTFPDVLPNSASEKRHEPFVEIRRAGRVTDGVVSMCRHPGKHDRVIGVGMHQFGAAHSLRPRQRALVLLAMGEIRRLVARGHLVLPPVESRDLPPRLRQVLDRLLVGQTPKRIARELGLSVWTIRDHVQRLYHHFGVSGRDELMARFVGHSRGGGT